MFKRQSLEDSAGSALLDAKLPELAFGDGRFDPPIDEGGDDPFDDDFSYDPHMAGAIDRWARPRSDGGLGAASEIAAKLCEVLLESEPTCKAYPGRWSRPESITQSYRGHVTVSFQWTLREGDPRWYEFERVLREEVLNSKLWSELKIDRSQALGWLGNEEFYWQVKESVLRLGFGAEQRKNGAFEAYLRRENPELAAADLGCARAELAKIAERGSVPADIFARTCRIALEPQVEGKSYYSSSGPGGNGPAISLQGHIKYRYSYRDKELTQNPDSKSEFLRSAPEDQMAVLHFIETLLAEGHESEITENLSAEVHLTGSYHEPEIDFISVYPEKLTITSALYPQDFEDIPRLGEMLESTPLHLLQALRIRVLDHVRPESDYMDRVWIDYVLTPSTLKVDGANVTFELAADVDQRSFEFG